MILSRLIRNLACKPSSLLVSRCLHEDFSVRHILENSSKSDKGQNVELFLSAARKLEPADWSGVMRELSGRAEGLDLVMNIRGHCNELIRALPRPELMKLDKMLLTVLAETVTPDSCVVRTVTPDSSLELVDTVRTSDRVHPITSEAELQNRLAKNRSVFILTHTLLPSRPLVILHVAHSRGMFQCVSDIKEGSDHSSRDTLCRAGDHLTRSPDLVEDRGGVLSCLQFTEQSVYSRVNTFYSISSLEIALRGIPCGGWCISKAKTLLTSASSSSASSTINTTLSPIPGFRAWLKVAINRADKRVVHIIGEHLDDLKLYLQSPSPTLAPPLAHILPHLAAFYLVHEKQRGCVLDPVGHFHVGNGAVLWGLRWGGVRSSEMMGQSMGLMVNYLYDEGAAARARRYEGDHKEVSVGAALRDLHVTSPG